MLLKYVLKNQVYQGWEYIFTIISETLAFL